VLSERRQAKGDAAPGARDTLLLLRRKSPSWRGAVAGFLVGHQAAHRLEAPADFARRLLLPIVCICSGAGMEEGSPGRSLSSASLANGKNGRLFKRREMHQHITALVNPAAEATQAPKQGMRQTVSPLRASHDHRHSLVCGARDPLKRR
jgi:hypothetical protein